MLPRVTALRAIHHSELTLRDEAQEMSVFPLQVEEFVVHAVEQPEEVDGGVSVDVGAVVIKLNTSVNKMSPRRRRLRSRTWR
jgi:hypothetical protein